MEIHLSANGDKKPIGIIKEGKYIKLIGPNGIGKTTAADFLEIAFGEFSFKDKGYENIKSAFTDCDIKIKTAEEEYAIKLTPGTWIYLDSEFKLKEDSIGICTRNGKSIKPNELRKLISVKVIRGDEDLEKQIELVSAMFNVILKKRKNDTLLYLEVLDEYLKEYEDKTKSKTIEIYKDLQEKYAKTEQEYQNIKEDFDKIKLRVDTNELILSLINKLIIWTENDPIILKEQLEKVNNEISLYESKERDYTLKRERLENTLSSIDKERRESLNNIFSELKKVRKNKGEISRKMKTEFPIEWEDIQDAINNKLINKYQEKKIERLNELQAMLDEIEKGSVKLNEKTLTKFTLILKLVDECREEGLGDKLILNIEINGIELKLTIEEFRRYLEERIAILSSDPEIGKLKAQRDKIGEKILTESKMKEKLESLKKIVKKEFDLINKKSTLTKDITLSKFMEPQIEKNLNSIDILIEEESQVRNHIDQLKLEKLEIEDNIKKTKDFEPVNKLEEQIKKILLEIPSDLEKKNEEINEVLGNDKNQLVIKADRMNELSKNLSDIEKQITKIKKAILEIAKLFGYSEVSKWIDYLEKHLGIAHKIMNDLDNLKDILKDLTDRFTKIEFNKPFLKKERDKRLKLISEVYNKYFLSTYKDQEFFKYVFKGYKAIKQFDITNKDIIFLKENDKLDQRKLKEFSSGEKAYAFIRAMIILSKQKSKYNILIVDEAYALMDYMRTGDLTDFQKELIRNEDYDKIINILPMSTEPNELEDSYISEFENLGYYHEIIGLED